MTPFSARTSRQTNKLWHYLPKFPLVLFFVQITRQRVLLVQLLCFLQWLSNGFQWEGLKGLHSKIGRRNGQTGKICGQQSDCSTTYCKRFCLTVFLIRAINNDLLTRTKVRSVGTMLSLNYNFTDIVILQLPTLIIFFPHNTLRKRN